MALSLGKGLRRRKANQSSDGIGEKDWGKSLTRDEAAIVRH